MQLSFVLVFALTILSVQSRVQEQGRVQDRQDLTSNLAAPIGNCVCTPFYKCFDNETAPNLNNEVDDRHIITVKQDGDPEACADILDVCCYSLVSTTTTRPTPTRPTPTSPSSQPPQTHTSLPTQTPSPLPPTTSHTDECGVRNEHGVKFEMKGFKDGQAQYGEFPWMAALLTSNTGHGADQGAVNLFVGGGSLIDPLVVLTAAHKPFDLEANKRLSVRLGEWNFAGVNEPTRHQDIPVRQVINHPRFQRDKRTYNLALLVLERPAELGETVGTICLPSNPRQNFDGQQCIVSGWGKNVFGEEGRYQRIMKEVSVNMVGHKQCETALRTTRLGSTIGIFDLHQSFICAGDQGQDACTGDGGSPLVCPTSQGHYVQVGVSAWGIGCGTPGIPGVYASVAPFIGWIQDHLTIIRNGAS